MTEIPENFAKYQVEKVLGEGAMGIVYAGYDPGIGRKVAIKTIHAHLLQGSAGDELRRRFTMEVKAVGKLSHPNIVAIYDTDEVQDEQGVLIPYFVMEFVTGRELQHYIADGVRFPLSKSIDIACQILEGFACTHELGVIHRDVKPANIFLTDDGRVKIADFGIARMENSSLTQTGAVIGTPNYMSPEQCSGQSLDSRSDLFSIAVVIYELLTGEKPFAANSVHATMMKVVQSNPESPSTFNPSLPKSLDAILGKALSKSPAARYQDADSFARALAPLRDGLDPDPEGSAKTRIAPRLRTPANKSSSLLPLFGGVAAALVVAAGAGGYFFMNGGDAAPDLAAREVVEGGADVKPFATDLPLETREKIERLLKVANVHEEANRLIFPPTSSAYYVYNTVFEIDPGNPRAKYGLEIIAQKLEQQAEDYYRNRDFETLSAHLQGGLAAFPDNETLRQLNQQLAQLRHRP